MTSPYLECPLRSEAEVMTEAKARAMTDQPAAASWATAAERDRLLEDFERLRGAISDNLPGLSAIDDGAWHEHTGDLVLKEEQWNAIVVATRELRMALAGGEARAALDEVRKS